MSNFEQRINFYFFVAIIFQQFPTEPSTHSANKDLCLLFGLSNLAIIEIKMRYQE